MNGRHRGRERWKKKRKRGSNGTKAKKEKRGEEKPAGTWSTRRKALKTFCKRGSQNRHRYTFLHTQSRNTLAKTRVL